VRRLALLERADDLHRHADSLETLAGLTRALQLFSEPGVRMPEEERVWLQTRSPGGDEESWGHGPAFRETAALRNRALRLVAAAIAKVPGDLDV
jgi:hypothetical protein